MRILPDFLFHDENKGKIGIFKDLEHAVPAKKKETYAFMMIISGLLGSRKLSHKGAQKIFSAYFFGV